MARPTKPRTPAQHIEALGRMLRQVEADEGLGAPRKRRIARSIGELLDEFRSVLETEAAE